LGDWDWIAARAVSAVLVGDEIHVTRADGWKVICTHSGSQKRMLK
jgi:hypothetical protein